MRRIVPLLVFATIIAGCGTKASESETAPAQAPATTPVADSAAAPVTAPPGEDLSGTVLEKLPAPPYVYLRLQTSKGEIWSAVSDAPVEVGAQVTVYRSMKMSAFVSKSLQRTFDEIYFGSLTAPGAAAMPAGNPHSAVSQAAPTAVDKVEKASGAEARNVEETWSEGAALAGKSVTVRGKVVKYNPGVMGKNWIHLQDGSGSAAKGTHDIVLTTKDTTAVGDVINASGTVRTGVNLGSGYVYAVLVEDVKIRK